MLKWNVWLVLYISCNILSTNISNDFHHYKFIPSNLFHIYLLEAWWYPQWTRNSVLEEVCLRDKYPSKSTMVFDQRHDETMPCCAGESTKFAFGCLTKHRCCVPFWNSWNLCSGSSRPETCALISTSQI